jgi:microcystin-dependent protein
MSEPFLGQITLYPYEFAPYGWMDCAGQILPLSQYSTLFALLGVYYGGNGTSNFALPNLQGRVTVGQGQLPGGSDYVIGEEAGEENVTLLSNQSAIHNHTLNATTAHGTVGSTAGNLLAAGETGTPREPNTSSIYNPANPNTTLTPLAISPAGGTVPHNNLQPFLVLRYCIAMSGVFPARG